MPYLLLLVPLLIGMGVVVQAGANTQLSQMLANPFIAGLISFVIGTLCLLIINIVMRSDFSVLTVHNIAQTHWWMWLGGLMGAFFITSVIVIAPKIGPTQLFGLIIASQLTFSAVVDHYGWLGFQAQPINIKKIVGVLFLMAGTFLIQWGKR
ncbi:DMT family transporter [Tunicatimonas pelagia]|uniref:DMT family transporter n=1 Tax=Tunicatimonas pelagia TaxID=931531 RepID=UPI0026660FE0|nr:DMT family transporter [Tunicatimonas pelagia]WKN40642.1 DMT family transporter [Tunicatimonas pelagia]